MSLNENADLDPSQVEDLRGAGGGGGGGGGGMFPGLGGGGGGGGGLPGGGGAALGCLGSLLPMFLKGGKGGKLGLVLILVICCVGGFCLLRGGGLNSLGDLGGLGGGTAPQASANNSALAVTCSKDNPKRFDDPACRNLAYINSIQAYWQKSLPQNFGKPYQVVPTRYFSGSVNTACGAATSGVGPFYCPGDNRVYIDLSFYDELARRFGAPGQFAQAYVLAHEYGHHVQTLLGTEAEVRRAQQRDPRNANRYSVAMELQADCYAGVWAKSATSTTSDTGVPFFTNITTKDLDEALNAAAAVGDDTIQKKAGGSINEDGFTHGSAAQRQQWFRQGYTTGDPKQCNTFS
ncbi:putative metalloprotease [Allocatelliglobosispora scoriae]|uniref:Putative metalloprotease n=1 Tax=Allocatelliglobosispora scoriae TaxID=643052 RepID=A0A841C1Y7_9ACTN|nr:neutral zinc metallopeptidase [Allocatelliglobosispora scoriae]MBB5873072.1 putative metalloprotease [Allocatelliglobosispora scoriae]